MIKMNGNGNGLRIRGYISTYIFIVKLLNGDLLSVDTLDDVSKILGVPPDRVKIDPIDHEDADDARVTHIATVLQPTARLRTYKWNVSYPYEEDPLDMKDCVNEDILTWYLSRPFSTIRYSSILSNPHPLVVAYILSNWEQLISDNELLRNDESLKYKTVKSRDFR